jgi:hypothetical protein
MYVSLQLKDTALLHSMYFKCTYEKSSSSDGSTTSPIFITIIIALCIVISKQRSISLKLELNYFENLKISKQRVNEKK